MDKTLIPNDDNLLIINELDYLCSECKKVISSHEMKYQKMPSNFNIAGLSAESDIPKCPYCGTLAFFGMPEKKGNGL